MPIDPETKLNAPQLLKLLRERKRLSQDQVEEVSKKLSPSDGFVAISQSTLAQIETSKGKALRPKIIRTLAHIYGVNPDVIFAAYAHQRYGMSGAKSKVVSRQILDIDELADWEREPDVMELWVFAPHFVDPDNENIRDAVLSILNRGGEVTYFTYEGDRVTQYIQQLDVQLRLDEKDTLAGAPSASALSVDKLDRMSFVFLPRDSFHLPTSFVVSNPMARLRQSRAPRGDTPIRSNAYIVLTEDKERPSIGIEVNDNTAVFDYISRLFAAREQQKYSAAQLLKIRGTKETLHNVVWLHGVRNDQR
ncbi:MAG: helix-turn-helix domain-containing protein [Gammaproteobacteria bacterium]